MMKSLAFPNMLNSASVKTLSDHEATASNLKLLLLSEKGALFGDPYFGTNLRKLIFEQNNAVLKDIVIDDIYTAILQFMPQLVVNRDDITITSDTAAMYVNIKATNMLDITTDLYTINLIDYEVD